MDDFHSSCRNISQQQFFPELFLQQDDHTTQTTEQTFLQTIDYVYVTASMVLHSLPVGFLVIG